MTDRAIINTVEEIVKMVWVQSVHYNAFSCQSFYFAYPPICCKCCRLSSFFVVVYFVDEHFIAYIDGESRFEFVALCFSVLFVQ